MDSEDGADLYVLSYFQLEGSSAILGRAPYWGEGIDTVRTQRPGYRSPSQSKAVLDVDSALPGPEQLLASTLLRMPR